MVRVEKKNLHENANNICIVYRATGNIDPCNPIPVWKRKGPDRTLQVKWTACILRYRCVRTCCRCGCTVSSIDILHFLRYRRDIVAIPFFFFFIFFVYFRVFLSYFFLFSFFFLFFNEIKCNVKETCDLRLLHVLT